jgi:opacity protein-like surface antigen
MILILAGVAPLVTGVAHAADYPQPPPVYVQPPPPPPQECCDSWYLRGFVGAGVNASNSIEAAPMPADTYFASNSVADSYFIGAAVGYNWNNWLRFDVSGEYRAKTRLTALARTQPGGAGPVAVDQYEGNLNSWIFLVNAFVDLGTWECFTPFVGAGIGGAYNMVSDFSDVTPSVAAFGGTGSSFGLGRGTGTWNLAWALYAGVSYAVSKNFNIDLTYRYLSYGSAKDTVDCDGGCGGTDFTFKDLHSHDIMLGLRWTCCDVPLAPPPPRYVYQPPPPVYTPPPVYQQPLHSKG